MKQNPKHNNNKACLESGVQGWLETKGTARRRMLREAGALVGLWVVGPGAAT